MAKRRSRKADEMLFERFNLFQSTEKLMTQLLLVGWN